MESDLNSLLIDLHHWILDARERYIEMNYVEIERKAAELEVTCDYYIEEFI